MAPPGGDFEHGDDGSRGPARQTPRGIASGVPEPVDLRVDEQINQGAGVEPTRGAELPRGTLEGRRRNLHADPVPGTACRRRRTRPGRSGGGEWRARSATRTTRNVAFGGEHATGRTTTQPGSPGDPDPNPDTVGTRDAEDAGDEPDGAREWRSTRHRR